MSKALKYLKWTALGITGTLLSVVLFLVLWIDPNDYRDDVTQLVKEKTGLILAIKGDIGWTFYPAIGFSIEGLSLATAEGEQALAQVGKAAVSVELLPLFQRKINVKTLFVDGLAANLVVDEQGKGNWEALTAGGADEPTAEPEEESTGPAPEINLPQVVVTNAVLDYDDRAAKSHYTVTVKELVAEDVNTEREFPLHLVAAIDDHKAMKVDIDTRAFVMMDLAAKTYGLRALDFKGTVAGILSQPLMVAVGADIVANMQQQVITVGKLAVDAGNLAIGKQPARVRLGANINADLGKKLFTVNDLTVNAADLNFTGKPITATVTAQAPVIADLTAGTAKAGPLAFTAGSGINGTLAMDVTGLTKELAWAGTLAIAPFNAKTVMQEFGIKAPATTDPAAMTKVALNTALEGSKTRAMLEKLDIRLDSTSIRGRAGIADFATTALVFDLAIDAINADRYLPPAAPATAAPAPAPAAATAAGGKPAPLLPVETLRTLNIDGKFAAGTITLMEWPMTKLAVGIRARDGDVRIDPISAGVLQGSVKGNVRIDARGDQPRIVTDIKLNKVEIGGVVKRFAKRDLLTGKVSMNVAVDATGNDVDSLLKKAVGNADISFADATLKGMNINNVLTETLTEKLGPFAMLMPDYQQKLPKELQQDTAFKTLATALSVKDGVAKMPKIDAGTKDGKISGSGQFGLLSKDFDYTLAMRTDKLKDNKYFANAEFPVHCKGNIAGAPADWCRPDGKAIGDMIKKAAENAAKDKLKGELAKKLGVESVDSAALKQQAQQAIDAEKKKAEEQVKKKAAEEMQKAFKKLF